MSTLKVAALQGVSASSDAITLANDGTCTANLTNRTNKNLVVNGAFLIAQRSTSSTSQGYGSVDRFRIIYNGTDEAPTQAQADVAAGTTPYTSGFRKSFKVTNGNQTGGAGGSDYIMIRTTLEAQDIANSGWNYTSTSSYITLSFWVKSSVAQNFYGHIRSIDGTGQRYAFETGSLSADTWTKVTKTISGNSNLQFDNNANEGLHITMFPFFGTDYTDSGVSLNTWGAYVGGTQTPDQTSTWYTTNDATFEITGVQLEVSDHATDFEHRSFADELNRCFRYYEQFNSNGLAETHFASGYFENDTTAKFCLLYTRKRAAPTITASAASTFTSLNTGSIPAATGLSIHRQTERAAEFRLTVPTISGADGQSCILISVSSTEATIKIDSEL